MVAGVKNIEIVDGSPVLHVDYEEAFEDYRFQREPHSSREAYWFICAKQPIPRKVAWLSKQWGWTKPKVRKFLSRMIGLGLIEQNNDALFAIDFEDAVANPDYHAGASWRSIRERILCRDGYVCRYCGSSKSLHCDHVVPRAKGGLDIDSNLVAACASCNLSKGAKSLDEWGGPK